MTVVVDAPMAVLSPSIKRLEEADLIALRVYKVKHQWCENKMNINVLITFIYDMKLWLSIVVVSNESFFFFSHDAVTLDVDRDVSTACCLDLDV